MVGKKQLQLTKSKQLQALSGTGSGAPDRAFERYFKRQPEPQNSDDEKENMLYNRRRMRDARLLARKHRLRKPYVTWALGQQHVHPLVKCIGCECECCETCCDEDTAFGKLCYYACGWICCEWACCEGNGMCGQGGCCDCEEEVGEDLRYR